MPAVNWITITMADLPADKAAALVAAMQTAALGDGQADPMPAKISRVITRIRQEIAAGGKTRLSADATKIPPSLQAIAVRMVLREGQSRLNAVGALPLSDDEREEWRQDTRYLERIAKGDITVEEPTDPESSPTMQATAPSPMISGCERGRWGREAQEGV